MISCYPDHIIVDNNISNYTVMPNNNIITCIRLSLRVHDIIYFIIINRINIIVIITLC